LLRRMFQDRATFLRQNGTRSLLFRFASNASGQAS